MRLLLFILTAFTSTIQAQDFEIDTYSTGADSLKITFIGHGSLLFQVNGKNIFIDPSSREANYSIFPKADLILITHHHGDHCDPEAISKVRTDETQILATQLAVENLSYGTILQNNEEATYSNIKIEAIPAYNLVHKRESGEFFHPKGSCNSYILTIGDKRIFIGGDTENTPEMKALKDIDIAFLPMNLPYTMTPEMVADAAKTFKPKILYPYHYGKTDTSIIMELMKSESQVKTIIRNMP